MKTISYIALTIAGATIFVGASLPVDAARSKDSVAVMEKSELPSIRIEKSLFPARPLSVESRRGAAIPDHGYHSLANAIVRGLLVANRTREIGYAAPLSYKVQDVVFRLRRGDDLEKASRRGGVSNQVVSRLLKLGTRESDIN
jgi:hypothetical protein